MHSFKATVVAGAFVLIFLSANVLHAAIEESIAGRLISGNATFSCDHCVVTLLSLGVRPVATAFVDMSGGFTFNNVPRGAYTIHVELDGFETVDQPVDAYEARSGATIVISLTRKAIMRSSDGGGGVVDVSEFLQRYPRKAVSLFEKGRDSLKKKDTDDAIKNFRHALELAPTFYEAHNQLGIAYIEAGRSDEAESEFRLAHELNSTAIEPLLNLTKLYIDENQPDRAVTAGEQAVKTNSRSAPAFFSLGMALYKAAMLDRAEAALKRALELAPKMANAHLLLANIYLKLRQFDDTVQQLDKYIAENPNSNDAPAARRMRDQVIKAKDSGTP